MRQEEEEGFSDLARTWSWAVSSRGPPEKGVEPRRLSGSSPSQLPPTDRESERDKENFRVFFFSSGVNLALLTRWVGIQISNPLYSPARGRSGARFTVGPSRRDADCGPRRILYRSRAVWACAVQAGALCLPVQARGPWPLHRGQGRRFGTPNPDPYSAAVQSSNKRARR